MGYVKEKTENNKGDRSRRCNNVTNWLDILYVFVIVILLIHLTILQIIDPHRYRERGKMQRASHDFELRGDIYDRNGIKLATDRIYYNIYVRPVDYSKRETPEKIANLIAPVLNLNEKILLKKISNRNIKIHAVKKNVDRDSAQKVMKII